MGLRDDDMSTQLEDAIVTILNSKQRVSIDEMAHLAPLDEIASALLSLTKKGLIQFPTCPDVDPLDVVDIKPSRE